MRKEKDVTIIGDGRDKGKVFHLTEMGAIPAEKWAIRACGAIAKTGFDFDPSAGWNVLVALGFHALLKAEWSLVEPLLDEMMTCVQFKAQAATRPLFEGDIEEIATVVKLRDEVFELHSGFSIAAALSNLAAAKSAVSDTPSTSTSAPPLEP